MLIVPKKLIIDLELLSSTDAGKILFFDLANLCSKIALASMQKACAENIFELDTTVSGMYSEQEYAHAD